MGADTVGYHKETVMGRADDHPGQALDYYAERGETPLRWGGDVAARLGLAGEVTPEQYEAVFGPAGLRDPLTGERLVNAKTPGFEIVVAAHKTTALLGVVGHAEDMHALLDVETAATIGWLEQSLQQTGGRRGREARITPTAGLIYAITRHGTSRAGDPSPHDHVLIANATVMLDDQGGYKALFSALLRDRVEAATMYGRLCSAYEAVQRGYAIELDNGPSGRLRHWRVKGIPTEAGEKLSKRSDAIGEYLSDTGHVGYRARNIAARATREVKRGTGIEELQPRWEAELAEIGWPVERLRHALDAARLEHPGPAVQLTNREIDAIATRLLDVDGEFLARGKVFTRYRLLAEIAPLLYGHDPAELDHVLDRIIASPLVVPLIGVSGTRERVYTATEVLVTEHAISASVERLIDANGPQLDPDRILRAVAAKQHEIGEELTDGQRRAIDAICGSGRAVDVVVGIAGSGKTTALEDAGYRVIGTATSGQAARTLSHEAAIEARTMRSLLWRLERRHITLDHDSVVILDEAGMTADADMARLLLAVEAARAKVVIVGDDRQLSPVGPGGALHQVLTDHPGVVAVLTENMRQRNPAERDALLHLRSGNLDHAIDWYATNDRIANAPDRTDTLVGMVDDWIIDTEAGADALMLAWQRRNVADLNRLARDAARQRGWLQGPDLETPDGRLFAAGDTVVMLAPNYRGQLVTSERAHVIAIDEAAQAITIQADDGRQVTLHAPDLAAGRIDHGYALTVHREQGATSDRTHFYADGGGRELAYVATSSARHHTTIHTVADDLDYAVERLRDDWSRQQHDTWLTPTTEIGDDPRLDPAGTRDAQRSRLRDELQRTLALAPPDVTAEIHATYTHIATLEDEEDHLLTGTGTHRHTPAGRASRQLRALNDDLDQAYATREQSPPWQRRGVVTAERHLAQLERDDQFNQQWHREHPEHAERVDQLEQALHRLDPPAIDTPAPATLTTAERLQQLDADLTETRENLAAAQHILDRLDQLEHLEHPAPEMEPPDKANDFGLGL